MTDSDSPLTPAEQQLLALTRGGHEWLRAVLCTLARRGVAYRAVRPEAAGQLLATLATSPLYKAGQFLFDLMEWEDFMLDGKPPTLLPTVLDATALGRLSQFLDQVKGHLEGAQSLPEQAMMLEVPSTTHPTEPPPPLEGGFYLYQDVVLGVLSSVTPFLESLPE
jgi:hypothetical protein